MIIVLTAHNLFWNKGKYEGRSECTDKYPVNKYIQLLMLKFKKKGGTKRN